MVETQLDRIENMLKVLTEARTTILLTGSDGDKDTCIARVAGYSKKEVG
jgi:hypothetical protein